MATDVTSGFASPDFTFPTGITDACVVCVIKREAILIGRDPRDDSKLTLPGGKVEPNESVADAAVRELHEEAGLQVRRDSLVLLFSEMKVLEVKGVPRCFNTSFLMCNADDCVESSRLAHPDKLTELAYSSFFHACQLGERDDARWNISLIPRVAQYLDHASVAPVAAAVPQGRSAFDTGVILRLLACERRLAALEATSSKLESRSAYDSRRLRKSKLPSTWTDDPRGPYCELCDSYFSSDVQLLEHTRGKKHRAKLRDSAPASPLGPAAVPPLSVLPPRSFAASIAPESNDALGSARVSMRQLLTKYASATHRHRRQITWVTGDTGTGKSHLFYSLQKVLHDASVGLLFHAPPVDGPSGVSQATTMSGLARLALVDLDVQCGVMRKVDGTDRWMLNPHLVASAIEAALSTRSHIVLFGCAHNMTDVIHHCFDVLARNGLMRQWLFEMTYAHLTTTPESYLHRSAAVRLKGVESAAFSEARFADAARPFRTVQLKEQIAFEKFEASLRPLKSRPDSHYDFADARSAGMGWLVHPPSVNEVSSRFVHTAVRWASDVRDPQSGFASPPSLPPAHWTDILYLPGGKGFPSALHELPALNYQPRVRPPGFLHLLRSLLAPHGDPPRESTSAASDSLSLGPCVSCELFERRRVVWITGVPPQVLMAWSDMKSGLGASVHILMGPGSGGLGSFAPVSYARLASFASNDSGRIVILCDNHDVDDHIISLHKSLNAKATESMLVSSFVLMVVPPELQLPDLTTERALSFCGRFNDLVTSLNRNFGLGSGYRMPRPRLPMVPVFPVRLRDFPQRTNSII